MTSDYPGGRRVERKEVGYLPKFAITEWLIANAPCSVTLREDTCGNLATADTDHIVTRKVLSSHGEVVTNLAWAKAEVKKHNIEYPLNPWIIRHSHKMPEYICICQAMPGEL